jgi:hypothetical protein
LREDGGDEGVAVAGRDLLEVDVLLERTSGQKKLLSRIWNKLKPTPAGAQP